MPNNKYDYTVKIGADIKNLKKDIKSELASVLREVDNVGDAVSKGITPDTKEFESKIASLESKMEKLAQNSKDVEQQVSSMKTAFKGFTELEASMKAIGEQNKEMYETFIKMTPYLQEFAKTFTAMKPEQAGAAFASMFKDAQNSAQQAADVTKKTFHEVETAAVNGAKVVNGAVETTGQSINNITQNTKEAVKELERLQGIRKKYGSDKSYSGKDGQKDLRQEISKLGTAYTEQQRIFEETDSSAANYGEELTKLIEKGQQLLALTDKLNAQAKDNLFDTMGIDASEINDDIDEYLKLYQKKINSATTQIGKIELKPLKLKVDISTDDELISQINKAIERIQSNTKINPLKIPLDFIDVGEEEVKKNNKKKKKTKNVKVDTENDRQQEVEVDSRLKSVVKEIESLQESFDKIKTPLLNDIKQWRNNLEEYLTLQFKWKKVSEEGDEEGISALFNDINHYAEKHPIWLNPDTNKLISEIENDLAKHQFKLDLSGSGLKLSGNVSSAVPVAIVGGGNAYQNPTVQRTIKQGVSSTSTATTKSEAKKDTSSVDKNSKAVEKNSDVISDVINEFKTYSQKTNETIARANKTIERLTAQNEKLDKNKPEDAEKIAENQRLIKKAQEKKDTAQSRMSALSSVTGIDIQNINNIDNDTLVATVTSLVQDRNEIVDVISTTKIGGASNSKNFLTKAIRDIVDSIKAAQEALGIEVKDADTVSKEIAAKDYLKDAEQLTRMGMALKTANREIRNNIVPTEDSLQQVVDVFGGRGLTSVTQSAQNLKNVLEQYHDVFESDGGYQEYITRLNDEIAQLQSEIDELSKHPRKNKAAIAEKKGQLGVKQFELEDIQSNVEPVLNIFKESIKGLPGQIAELLKGYKFIVEFVDADGKKVTESFNDASARAPRDTEPYYKRSAKMFDRINAGEVTSITPKSTPNDSVFSVLYGDKISKSTAIQQIIDAYNQLDKKAQLFVNSLIDIKKLTDENISLSEKWALVENSGIIGIDMDKKGQARMGRSINVNKAIGVEELIASKKKIISNKSKIQSLDPEKDKDKIADLTEENKSLLKNIANIKAANREIDSFIDTIVGAYFGVNSNAKLKAGQQKMLMRGTPISYGSSKNATVAHPEEQNYQYNVSTRSYRTVPNYKPKSIDELNAKLEENKKKVEQVNSDLASYRISLNQLEELNKEEYEQRLTTLRNEGKVYSPEKLQSMQKAYPEVKSYGDFVSKHNSLQSETSSLQDSIAFIQNETSREKTNLSSLETAVKSKNDQITELEEYITAIQKKGIAEYIRTLDKRIENAKSFKERIILKEKKEMALGDQNHTVLKNGEVVKETKKELVARRTEQLEILKASRDEDLGKISRSKDQIAQNERMVESLSKDLEEGMQKLQELRIAFSDMYSQYLQTWIDNVDGQITSLEKIAHLGKASDEQKKELFRAKEKKKNLSARKSEFEQSLSVEIETGYEGEISRLETNIQRAEQELEGLEAEKANIETRIANLKNGTIVSPETPTKAGSEEAKTYARREIEAIEEDLEIADSKIKAAEDKKKDFDDRIKVLKKKGEAASEVKESQAQATGYAVQTAKNTDDYKEFQKNLHQQFEEGSITWDEYSEKIQTKIDEIVNKLKEAEPEKYTGKSAEELTASLNKEKQAQQDIINEAKAYKKELQAQRQEAMAFAQITEEELANQRAITEEKKEQVQVTQQEKTVQVDQVVESRIQEQSNQVDTARVQELDNKMSAIDEEIAQLRAEIKSESKKKKTTTSTKKLTDKQQAKVDEQFLGYVSQIKAKEISKKVNVKDVDLSEAINMQKQLNALAEQGNQNTEEYLTLQRQLSELISKRTNQLKGTGRNGYATSAEKYDWIKANVSKDVADFYSSDQYVAQAGKFDTAVASRLGNSLVEGFSNEFRAQCVEAAKQAIAETKAQGGSAKEAKKAAMSVVQKLLDSVEQGVVEGVKEEVADSSSDVASKKARIKELTAQKKQYQAEKEQLVTTAQSTSTAAPFPVDEVALQAGTVIVSGGSDGTGPWALETTLQRTNEILNSISGKIDSVKGGSGSDNDSSTSGSRKKKKKEEEIDVNAIRQRLESEAADNRKRFSIDGLEDSIKSVQKFDEKTLKLYETFTLANGEAVKFTYSLNTMDGTIKSSYTTIANFEGVAKKAYTELGKSQIATKQLFEGFNFPQDKITAYNNAIAALNNKLKGLGENGITDPKDANEVEVLTGNVKKLRTEIENMVKASEKTANSGTLVKKFNAGEVDNVKASMKALAEEIPNASLAASNFNDKTNELTFTVKTGRNELTTLTYKFDELTQSVYETGRASKTTTGFFKSFFSDVGTKIAELARYYTGMSLLTEGLQQVRRGVQYVREIDLALTELKKVTDETDAAYTKFLQNMSKTASVVGSTTSELTNSAADWARLGYSMEQAGELAKNTAILMNVSEFDNVNDATSALISTLQAFNYSAEDSLEIVDKLNIVGNNFAISSDGIASGLQRSASTLVAAGNSLEQSIAMLAAGNKVMQDPEALGNALKVLSMRIRGTKTELEEAGEETDGMAENTSKLRKQVMALTNIDGNGGVDILTDSGAFRSTYDILYDIAKIWGQLNDYDPKAQAALLELLAGKTRGSQLAAILQNPEDLKAAYETAMNSAGSAMQENERYLDSIQGKIDKFTNSLQTFWMDAISSDFVKGVVDIGTTLLNILDEIVKKIGLVGTAIAGLGIKQIFKSFKEANNLKKFSDIFSFGKDKLFNISIVKEFFDTFENGYNEVINMASRTKGLDILAELANYDDASGQLGVLKDLLKIKDENTTVSKAFVKSILEEHAAELGLNAETVQAILNSELFAASQTGAAVGTDILTAAQTRLIAVLKGVKAAFLGLLAAHPVLTIIALVAAGIGAVYAAYKKWGPTHDNYIKKLEEETKNLKEIQENLKDLNSELETTKQRIEELESKGPLTLTEQEELDKLKEQNAELERQIKLEEARENRARNKQAKEAVGAFKTDEDFKVQFDTYSGIEIGNAFEQKLKDIQVAKDNLTKAEIDLQNAYDSGIEKDINKAEKKLNKAQEAYTNAQSSWDTLMKNNEEEYGDLEWFDGENLTEAQKKVNEIISTIQNYNDRAEILFGSAGAKQSALDRLFGERGSEAGKAFNEAFKAKIESGEIKVDANAFDNTSLEEAKEYYNEVMSEVQEKGIDITKTMYGNIDTNNRKVLYWTQENLTKYKDAIESWGETVDSMGDYSTVFGTSEEFEGTEIAFSPMLQTESGSVLLDKNTVHEYIYGLIDKARENGEEITLDVLLQLDEQGLEFEGQQIKNLIADVGDTAIKTGEAMHYVGELGAIEDAKNTLDKVGGSFNDVVKSAEDMINASPQLKLQLDSLGISAEDVARHFLDIDEAINQTDKAITVATTDISSLISAYESYASVLQTVNEIVFDGQAISEDAYESLKEYLGDVTVGEEDFSDAVDVTNGKVIKNTKLLKNLIAQKKKEQKATVSAAKAQSQLQYTKIVKQLQQAIKAMALDYKAYGYVTQATYKNIEALRSQISTIKNAIKEYSLLELKLSDVTNAYTEFENAKNRDAELTYGDSLIEGIQALNDGLATGKVGTETFKAAVDLIVPPEAYEGLDDYQDRLVAIHDYVDKNPLFADWFTVDEDGNFGIEFKNMAAFVQDMQNMGVFTGDDVTGFNFADGIKSIEDIVDKTKEWNDGVGVTKETIVAMLTELSKYDARWGDLLEELTMTDVDKAFKNTTEALDAAIAKQEQFFKDGKDPNGEGASEYAVIQQEINNCSDAFDKAQQSIINNTNAWIDANSKVETAKGKVADLTRELDQLKESGATDNEIQIKTNQLDEAKKELSDALQIKYGLEEPTQMDFQVSFETVQAEIDKWDEEHVSLAVDVVPQLEKDVNGEWKIPATLDLSDEDRVALEQRIQLMNNESELASLINSDESIDPIVSGVTSINDILTEIYNIISGGKEPSTASAEPVNGLELRGNTTKVTKPNTESSSNKTDTSTSSTPGFATDSIDQEIAAFNTEINQWWDEHISQPFYSTIDALNSFFTETLPIKWNEFWEAVGEKFNGFKEWANGVGESINGFFTETLPEKWDEFWNAAGEEFNNFKEWAKELGNSVETFFTETLPKKWDEFWEGVGEFFKSIPYAIGYFVGKVKDFFTETLPEKWDEFWEEVGNALTNIKEKAIELKDKVVEFFTTTIPTKWAEFWDGVSEYISTNITPALKACWDKVVEFFTVTIPDKWNAFWNSVDTFITETIPVALTYAWDKIVEFFTVTIPEKWNGFWDAVSEYVSTNITPALTEIWNKIVDFFTVTIPEKLNQFWDDIVTFVTETVPTAIENAKDGVTTFFTETIPGKINELWDGIASWISDKATSFWEFLKSGFKSGYEDATSGKDYNPNNQSTQQNRKSGNTIFAKGSNGVTSNERNAIVGELGRELVCDTQRGVYYTVGDNGTEMVDIPKGAIIYNHKQTEELLRNGKTSRGTLVNGGLSFAKGNAYATTPYWSDGYRHGLYGGYLSDDPVFKDTSKQWVDANQNWVDDFANAADGISDAADSLSDSADDFKETINWIEVLFTRIDNTLAEHEAYLATVVDSTGGLAEKNSIYNTVFEKMYSKASYSVQAANYYQKLADSILSGMDQVIASKVRNGTILIEEITDEALKENIDKALDYLDQVSQYKQQYYSTLEEIADKAVERQEEVANAYENEIGLVEHLNNTLEARNDLEEAKNSFATEAYYKAQISANKTMLKQYQEERKALQQVLDAEVAAGNVKIGSQQWFDMQQAIYDCDDAIIDMESSIEDLQNAINDLYWDRFDELINRFGYIEDELSNVIQLLSHDPDGLVMEELRDLTTTNWATGSGLASLGLYAQQMETAQFVANQYAEQIKELKKQYSQGRYNETEYLNKLNELINAQYENIEKYYDAKDAIVELNEARVDAIKDGIEKEIDAYDELINKKKELLNREQD